MGVNLDVRVDLAARKALYESLYTSALNALGYPLVDRNFNLDDDIIQRELNRMLFPKRIYSRAQVLAASILGMATGGVLVLLGTGLANGF
jgi:hypothetical protein